MKGGKAAENSFKSVIRVSESHMDLKPWSGMPSVLRPITTKDNHPLLLATCQSSLLHKRSTPVGPNQPSRPLQVRWGPDEPRPPQDLQLLSRE